MFKPRVKYLLHDRITGEVEGDAVTLPPFSGDVTAIMLATRVSGEAEPNVDLQQRTSVDPDVWENIDGGSFSYSTDLQLTLTEKQIKPGTVRVAVSLPAGNSFDMTVLLIYKPERSTVAQEPAGETETTASEQAARDPGSHIVFQPDYITNGNALPVISGGIDTQTFTSAIYFGIGGYFLGGTAEGTVKFQHSDDDGDTDPYTDIAGTSISISTGGYGNYDVTKDRDDVKRWIRWRVDKTAGDFGTAITFFVLALSSLTQD